MQVFWHVHVVVFQLLMRIINNSFSQMWPLKQINTVWMMRCCFSWVLGLTLQWSLVALGVSFTEYVCGLQNVLEGGMCACLWKIEGVSNWGKKES